MQRIVKVFLILAFFQLTSCSEKSSSNDQRQQQAQDIAKLERELSDVVGVYEGKVTFTQQRAPTNGKLSLYLVYVQDGTNPDGTVKVRPVLRGRFILHDYILESDKLILGGDYNGLNGALTLSSTAGAPGSSSPAPVVSLLSLNGSAGAGHANLSLSNERGNWGSFKSDLTSKVASTGAGATAEERDRRLRILEKLVGRYSNVLREKNPRYAAYKCADINLMIIEEQTELGKMPTLGGTFYFSKLFYMQIGGRSLGVVWDGASGDISLVNISGLQFNGGGTLLDGQLEISMTDKFGVLGKMTAVKDREPEACTDERESEH